MRWAMALGWLCAAGLLRAEVPMDLDSPFEKVALIRTKTGEVEKRELKKARLAGSSVEMEKMGGGVAIFPVRDVITILPLLPKEEDPCTVEQAEQALRLMKGTAPELLRQAGLESTQIQEWEKFRDRTQEIKKQKEESKRKERETNATKEFQDWLAQAGELRVSRTEKELKELRQVGEAVARKHPGQTEAIFEALAGLSQVQPKEKGEPLPELSRLNEVQPRLMPDDLQGWLAGGVLTLSFFGLLFGLAFLSSSLTRFKEGALFAGIVFGLVALSLLGGLIWTWLSVPVTGQITTPQVGPKMEELGIYLKNRTKPVYFFPKKQFSFSVEEWRSGVLGILPVSEEPVGLFKVKMKEGTLGLSESTWIWQQPLTALGIPLPLKLTFEGENPEIKSWQNLSISKVHLGRWLLPDSVAGPLKDSAISIWEQALSSAGLAGVKLEKNDQGMLLISVPAAGVRPKFELAKLEEKQNIYRKEISAEDLAQEFQKGHGKEFLGKFVLLEGVVERVGSGSEVSGVPAASKQEDSSAGQQSSSFGQGNYDSFYLQTGLKPVRCLIKSALVFVQDERKDIYLGPTADTISHEPFIKKGYRVKFMTEGRVEEVNRFGEIEVYGIRLDPDKLQDQIKVFDPNDIKKD
jgi:hypothetical protein